MVSPILTAMAAFLLAAIAAWMLASWHQRRRARGRLLRQLRTLAGSGTPGVGPSNQLVRQRNDVGTRLVDRLARFAPPLRDMDQLLEQAGLAWDRSTLFQLSLGLGLGGGFLLLAGTGSPPAALAGLAVGLLLPRLYVLRCRARRLRAFEEQLPEAIDLLSRAIRAGHAVPTGLRTVAEESQDPVATEFRRVFEEQKYGLPFEESMLALTRRVDLIDLRVMVVAILVQREVGGNLTEILDKISALIRTRFTLRRQLRVYTAQGRLSGYVLSLLPIAVAGIVSLFDPTYMLTLVQEPMGRLVLGSAVTLQLLGYFWIWRILKLDI